MSHVITEPAGRVRIIRLQRPEKKNALTVAMYEALTAALAEARDDGGVHVVLLAGAPGAFTAGNDIGDFASRPPSSEKSAGFRFLEELFAFPKPIVAAVDGIAVGIGTTLLLHCDLVVASERSRFRLPFVSLGLVPEAASSYLLPRLAGLQRASEWLLLGDFFDAAEARAAGVVNAVVAAEAVDGRARELAESIARQPPEAVRLTKRLIRQPIEEAVAAAHRREGALFAERLRSPEAMAAFAAFLEKKWG